MPRPPELITLGLLLILGTPFWSVLPAITGVALIALGATRTVASRWLAQPGGKWMLGGQFCAYTLLWALCAGARWDAGTGLDAPATALLLIDACLAAGLLWQAASEVLVALADDSPTC